jgi:hypothetical protein
VNPEIAELAGTAATTLVQLLTADGWQQVKERFTSFWGHAQPERADAIAGALEMTREDLLKAQRDDDLEAAAELSTEWQGRLRRLLGAHPEVIGDLRELLTELAPEAPAVSSVVLHAVASGNARVYQAGRDQKFTQR